MPLFSPLTGALSFYVLFNKQMFKLQRGYDVYTFKKEGELMRISERNPYYKDRIMPVDQARHYWAKLCSLGFTRIA